MFDGYILLVTADLSLLDVWPIKKFRLVGGKLCLDFCNSVGGKRGVIPRENFLSYFHFLSWCQQAGLVNAAQVELLKAKATSEPVRADLVLARAITLREALYRILMASIEGAKPSGTDLALLNSELAQGLGRLRISPGKAEDAFTWSWAEESVDLDDPLGPLAYSAGNLLVGRDHLSHVRQCGGKNCGWLFLDSSKNHSRRWCDMRDCGNLAKVRRHRQKHNPADHLPASGE